MKTSDFYYELPKELIAQDPLSERSASRLLVVDKDKDTFYHKTFVNVLDYLRPGDCLVLNDTKVIPARLLGKRPLHEGICEVFLLNRKAEGLWECLVRPGKKLRAGAVVSFGDGRLSCEITEV